MGHDERTMMTGMSDHLHAVRVAHGVWLAALVFGVAAHGLSGAPLYGPGTAAFIVAGAPALAVLVMGALVLDARWAAGLVVLWTAAVTIAAVLVGSAWPALAGWFVAPAAAASLLRPRAPLWEGGLFATVGLVLAALLAPAREVALSGFATALAPVAFVSVMVWGVRARQARDAEREQRARAATQRLLDGAGGVLMRVVGGDQVAEVGGACTALLGLPAEQASGHRAIDLVDPSSGPALTAALARARRRDAPEGVRVSVMGRALRGRVTPLGRGDVAVELVRPGPVDARVAVLERRHAEAAADAERKTQFYARLSHELRTPLNAVLGFADVMRAKVFGPMPVKYAEYADLIHESAQHLLGLVDSVVDLSKIESGAYALEMEVIDARDVLDAALRMTHILAEAANVTLDRVAPDTPVVVEADARALRQILINLLSNAIKFTPAGGRVTARVAERDRCLVLEVADTGPGLTPEEVAQLGQPYVQTRVGRQSNATGAGLGLAIVRALAQMHDGVFEAESVIGDGATMRVRAPVLCGDAAAPSASASIA